MLQIGIIEPMELSARQLAAALTAHSDTKVDACFRHLADAAAYLREDPSIDLLFCAAQLGEETAFAVFGQEASPVPVVYLHHNYDHLAAAFRSNAIGYLLTPVEAGKLGAVLNRYRLFRRHFVHDYPLHSVDAWLHKFKRNRMLVQQGDLKISLPLKDIAVIYAEERHCIVIDRFGCKYQCKRVLQGIETDLNDDQFFRINRGCLVNIEYIRGYKPVDKTRLELGLTMPVPGYSLIVSPERTPRFRAWLRNA